MASRRRACALALVVVGGAGCGLVAGLSTTYEAGDAGASEGGSKDGAASDISSDGRDAPAFDAGPPDARFSSDGCVWIHGQAPVRVDTYCIDSTEVTKGEYAAFVAATNDGGNTANQPPECADANTTFVPSGHWPDTDPNLPVGFVDWCDAYAYCAWAGKHMCGTIGGGAIAKASTANAGADEWYRACSAAGTLEFPYGNTFIGDEAGTGPCWTYGDDPMRVTTKPFCVGGYPGLFDMSGNVREWQNSCEADGTCLTRGGSINDNDDPNEVDCRATAGDLRTYQSIHVGFRCCTNVR